MSLGNDTCSCLNDDLISYEEKSKAGEPEKIYYADFKQTPINTTSFKTVSVSIPDCVREDLNFNICRYEKINPIYQVFNLNKYNGYGKLGIPIQIRVKFQPNIPFQDFLEKFVIWFDSNIFVVIRCSGYCIAPIVEPSTTELRFFRTSLKPAPYQSIILTNKSSAPAIYEFDFDDDESIFKIHKNNMGKIPANGFERVHFSFKTDKVGMYSMRIFCLICYHKPLVLNLLGIYSETDYSSDQFSFRRYSLPKAELSGYQAYFSNVVEVKTYVPPVSLSKSYINFGSVWSEDGSCNISMQTFSLTNHKSNGIRVEWLNENKVFSINPNRASVPPKESISFECKFSPLAANQLYGKTLRAQIFWNYDDEPRCVSVPLTECIRVMGHSFVLNQMIAKTNIEPSVITLPPCIPLQNVETTFMVENVGFVPIIYKFIPPKNSNIMLKPMLGIITNKRLIAVQFKTALLEKKTYIEQWMMVLNENCEKYVPVYLRVECATPGVTIGHNDSINFGTLQTETQSNLKVRIMNNTIYKISYEFENNNPSFFSVSPKGNILYPYDDLDHIMTYTASFCSKQKFFETVKMYVINNDNLRQEVEYKHQFRVYGNQKFSQLFAQPSFQVTKPLTVGTPLKFSFDLINWGDTTVHFTLFISDNQLITYTECSPYTFIINPDKGSLKPQESVKINISAMGTAIGFSKIKIAYKNRIREDSSVVSENLGSVDIFELTSNLVFPIIKFTDIIEYNFGKLFTKKHIWEIFKINEINATMNKLEKDKRIALDLYLPEMPHSEHQYNVILLLSVLVESETDVLSISRFKNCDCKPENVECTTFWKTRYNCPHRNMFNISLEKKVKDNKTYMICTCNITYSLEGYNVLSFVFDLSRGHEFMLNFHMQTTPYLEHTISTYNQKFEFILHDVYVGQHEAAVQCFWLYNNTDVSINYSINTQKLEDINSIECFTVFDFINPEGTINPFSRYALLLRFQPLESTTYLTELNGLMGDEPIVLTINAKGTGSTSLKQFATNLNIPETKIFAPNILPISLSRYQIPLQIMSTWNTFEFMLFITNHSEEIVFHYICEPVYFLNILSIDAIENGNCYLKPLQTQFIIIKVTSLRRPLSSDFIFNIKVENVCEEFMYENELKKLKHAMSKDDLDTRLSINSIFMNPPTEQYVNIYIPLHVVSSRDKDLYLTAEKQMKFESPPNLLRIDPRNLVQRFDNVEPLLSTNIMPLMKPVFKDVSEDYSRYLRNICERLIARTVFCKKFEHIVEIALAPHSPIYENYKGKRYTSNLTQAETLQLRKEDTMKLFSRPSLSTIANTMTRILKSSIQKQYNFNEPSTLAASMPHIDYYVSKHSPCNEECACKDAN